MSEVESRHPLAALVRRPLTFALVTTLLGAVAYAIGLNMPVGAAGVAVATLGAFAATTGVLTALLLLLGRITGLQGRSERAVVEGRRHMLLAGSRPPVVYRHPRPVAVPPSAPDRIDLTDPVAAAAPAQRDRAHQPAAPA